MGHVVNFAYGLNPDNDQMGSRCASAWAEARAVLSNYVPGFCGFSRPNACSSSFDACP